MRGVTIIIRRVVPLASLTLVLSACGGGTASTTATDSTTASTATTSTSGTSGATTTSAAVTTTSVAPTTTAGPTGVHPAFGGDTTWDDVWPEDGATAVYQVVPFPGATEDVEAIIEYGVEYRGAIVDRLVFASDQAGERGLVVYFDRTVPWVFNVIAAEVYATNVADGPSYTERVEGGMRFDGSHDVGESSEFSGVLVSEHSDGSVDDFDAGYRVTTTTRDGTLEVPYGTVDGLVHIEVRVGFPVVGDFDPASELWLHPELFLVRITGSPGWRDIQLVTPFA